MELFSRRHFVAISAAALSAAQLPAQESPAPIPAARLPESIRSLRPVTGRIQPITDAERAHRLERAQRLMAENQIADALFMTGGSSLFYFTGMRWWNSERMMAMLLPRRGDPVYITPAFEEARAREQIRFGHDVRTWQEDESPYRLVQQTMSDLGGATGTLAIEERTAWFLADGIAKAAPGLRLTSGDAITAGCREIKSPAELALMQLANEATLSVYRAVWQAVQPGMTNHDASALIAAAYQQLGVPGGASVQVGRFSAQPHGSLMPQIIRAGDIVMFDDGCQIDGYQSDITRTFAVGKPSDKARRVFDVVLQAQSAALAAARPGVEMQAVDAAARRVIAEAGYGADYTHFTHRLGHGIGLDGHEWPYLVRGNTRPLQPHMTFSDEPGIYLLGEFGVRLEDDMHIDADGAHLFTPQSHSLEQPFA